MKKLCIVCINDPTHGYDQNIINKNNKNNINGNSSSTSNNVPSMYEHIGTAKNNIFAFIFFIGGPNDNNLRTMNCVYCIMKQTNY